MLSQKLPQSWPCLVCGTTISLPKAPPGGWWLALRNNWGNPPAFSTSITGGSCPDPRHEYLIKVKVNGYTLKSILPYVCPNCHGQLQSEAKLLWEGRSAQVADGFIPGILLGQPTAGSNTSVKK